MARLVDLELKQLRELERQLGALPEDSRKAERRAIRRTLQFARSRMLKRASQESAITQKSLRQARRSFYSWNDEGGEAWLGTLDMKAGFVGRVSQQKKGAKVGQHKFPGAFTAHLYGRHSIFKRKGRSRFPVIEQTIPVEVDEGFMSILRYQADQRLLEQYISDLEYFTGARG